MTPEQMQLVRLSFVQVMSIKMQVGRLFYERLFTIAPDVRPMFKGDAESQARKLMDTLAFSIGSLKNPTVLSNMLNGLAKRHVDYGVRDEHYDKIGEALLWTLEKGLGANFTGEVKAAFTGEVKAAWAALYETVASSMKRAASGAQALSA